MKFTFRFHGGFKDGEAITCDEQAAEQDAAARVYLYLTDHGRVGARFSERRPFDEEIRKKVFESLTKPRVPRSRELDRLAGPSTPGDIFFSHAIPKDQLRAADDQLTYEYEVTRRETWENETIVYVDCVRDPQTKSEI